MLLSELVTEICGNVKDKEVAEKLIILAGMVDNTPMGAYTFEKASWKIIQRFIPDGNERANIIKLRMFLWNFLRDNPDAVNICRNYANLFDLSLSAEEIRELDITDILAQGLPLLRNCPH